MEKLQNKILIFYRVFVVLLATAFFADSVNLDDYIPDNFVFHSENPSFESFNADYQIEEPDHAGQEKNSGDIAFSKQIKNNVRVSYDLDSVFIEDASFPVERKLVHENEYYCADYVCPLAKESLYLLHCSLLI
jgi:hypothetical protein